MAMTDGKHKTGYRLITFTAVLIVTILFANDTSPAEPITLPLKEHPVTDVYDGWRLAVQAWTFRKFTFYEAIDKTESLGLHWIEAYPNQRLSPQKPDLKFNHNISPAVRKEVKRKLADAGVKLVNYGVVPLPNDEAECRKVFDFAKDMGIEMIVSEPPAEAFDLVDRLCNEYKIKVAIHNHPKPSTYWNPDKVLRLCKGKSNYIGACADIGHWMRSAVDPLEALKKLRGRIISLHFKDLNQFGTRRAHDVPWGTGLGNTKALLEELNHQGFEGVFSIEYEYNWKSSLPQIRQCVEYFDKVAAVLKPTGWHNLLQKDLSNCIYKPGSWTMTDGVLIRKGGGDIWTKNTYGNFVLDLEFKLAANTNSGIFLRTGNIKEWLNTAIEVQIFDSYGKTTVDTHDCGAIFDCLAPIKNCVRKPGRWNRMTIAAKDSTINVVLNNEPIIDMDLNKWTQAHRNPDGTKNKFNTAYKDMPCIGHIGFQDHGYPVWYRNIKIRTLSTERTR